VPSNTVDAGISFITYIASIHFILGNSISFKGAISGIDTGAITGVSTGVNTGVITGVNT
jgi:hypothetical protein